MLAGSSRWAMHLCCQISLLVVVHALLKLGGIVCWALPCLFESKAESQLDELSDGGSAVSMMHSYSSRGIACMSSAKACQFQPPKCVAPMPDAAGGGYV